MLNAPPRIVAKYAINIRRHSGGFTLDSMKHSTDYIITELLKRKLSGRKYPSDPVFGFIHLSNPHIPYTPTVLS